MGYGNERNCQARLYMKPHLVQWISHFINLPKFPSEMDRFGFLGGVRRPCRTRVDEIYVYSANFAVPRGVKQNDHCLLFMHLM